MARGRKKKQITIKDPESLAVLGGVCLVIAALLLMSLFFESEVLNVFKSYFGIGVIVMSFLLIVTALKLFGSKSKYNSFKVVFFLILFMLCFLGWVHLFAPIQSALSAGNNGEYGGIIGYTISEFVKERLAFEGTFVSLGILSFISILMVLDVTPKQMGEYIVKALDILFGIAKKLQVFVFNFINFAKSTKSKVDTFEMNLPAKAHTVKEGGAGDERQPLDPNSLYIKMVSDISGKKDALHKNDVKPDVNINLPLVNAEGQTNQSTTLTANPVTGLPTIQLDAKSEKKEPAVELDLSIRQYPNWRVPPLDLLDPLSPPSTEPKDVIARKSKTIEETLRSFNIEAKVKDYTVGPAVTQYFVDPKAGVKFTKISNLSKDLALTLASPSDLRIELIPNTSFIGIDVPNDKRRDTQLRESIAPVFVEKGKYSLGLAVGIDTAGKPAVRDLQKMPHLLVAGATGMGKSALVNSFIISLLMQKSPDELKFIMIDPKMVEMAPYDGIPHLLTSPITDMSKASTALKWAVNEMEERYKTLKDQRVRNVEEYVNQTGQLMPYIVIIIDEFSDLMMQYRAEVESSIIRLAQKSRAVGIHLIIATQRPTADVITGLIKSNVPARVALTVASSLDSRVVLDSTGAETLLGRGDLLFKTANDLKPLRIQGLWITNAESERILKFIREQAPDVEYNEDEILNIGTAENAGTVDGQGSDDPLFKQAAEIVISAQKGSASLLQTKMKIGYARAARLIDELEMAGVVGPQDGPRPRDVLINDMDAYYGGEKLEG